MSKIILRNISKALFKIVYYTKIFIHLFSINRLKQYTAIGADINIDIKKTLSSWPMLLVVYFFAFLLKTALFLLPFNFAMFELTLLTHLVAFVSYTQSGHIPIEILISLYQASFLDQVL